jgi:hypothetical protein
MTKREQIAEMLERGNSKYGIAKKLGLTVAYVSIESRTIVTKRPWYKEGCIVCGGKRGKTMFCTKHRNRYLS